MGTGTGVGLFAAGAVLYWAVDVDVPFVFDGALGAILMVSGAVALAATVFTNVQRSRSRRVVDHRY